MPALSVSAELKEYPPRAPPFGSRTFILLCNLLNWAVGGYPLPSTLSRQSAYWGSTHLLASLSDPPSPARWKNLLRHLWVAARRDLGCFHQQKAKQRVALFADMSQSSPIPAGLLRCNQPHIAGDLLCTRKTFWSSND